MISEQFMCQNATPILVQQQLNKGILLYECNKNRSSQRKLICASSALEITKETRFNSLELLAALKWAQRSLLEPRTMWSKMHLELSTIIRQLSHCNDDLNKIGWALATPQRNCVNCSLNAIQVLLEDESVDGMNPYFGFWQQFRRVVVSANCSP